MVELENEKQIDKSLLQQAIDAAAELKAANAEKKALLDREEAMRAVDAIGGRSSAGVVVPKPVEQTPMEYAKAVLSGSLNAKK